MSTVDKKLEYQVCRSSMDVFFAHEIAHQDKLKLLLIESRELIC